MVIAPITAATILNTVEGLFQGSSYDATHTKIEEWVTAISKNVQAAKTPGTAEYRAYVGLRCWAGDNASAHVQEYVQLWNDPSAYASGCGCEQSHGCRADAATALAQVNQLLGYGTPGPLSTADIPSGAAPSGGMGPTVQVNVPIPNSTLLGLNYGGVNLWVIGIIVVVIVWAVASRRRK